MLYDEARRIILPSYDKNTEARIVRSITQESFTGRLA